MNRTSGQKAFQQQNKKNIKFLVFVDSDLQESENKFDNQSYTKLSKLKTSVSLLPSDIVGLSVVGSGAILPPR